MGKKRYRYIPILEEDYQKMIVFCKSQGITRYGFFKKLLNIYEKILNKKNTKK